jgi:hypothetical protein
MVLNKPFACSEPLIGAGEIHFNLIKDKIRLFGTTKFINNFFIPTNTA